ncbi:molecular chaperone Hsp33 [Abyssicoccus albus]|jgi:molecular chaperone Hsp33|uniref:33 kDa chaperonin n=2 Tax=Abyssicoccus albus TaxID=1817405 RepID=A0A3N5C7V0_9BACL|nr:molecular chaperone Hsp33 [Abyssicoccus albus]
MKDYLVKALLFNDEVRMYAVTSTETVQEVQTRHYTWPTASAAIGRAMSATVMMGAMLKNDDTITVRINGNGPIGGMVIDGDAKGNVRGYVEHPQTHFPLNDIGKLDVRRAVGTDGTISVVKDVGLKDYFTGQTPIVSGELGEDFTYYLTTSEQVPSSVAVGVLVNPDNTIKASGGFIIQVMPFAKEETIDQLEKAIESIPPISKLIDEGYTPEQIIERIAGSEHKIVDTMPIQFKCKCSKERFYNAIAGLGHDEIKAMIEEDNGAEAVCHFCNEKYQFTAQELEALL